MFAFWVEGFWGIMASGKPSACVEEKKHGVRITRSACAAGCRDDAKG